MRTPLAILLVAALCVPAPAQTAAPKKLVLTVDEIMRGPGLVGYPPTAVRWSGDGQRVYFQWKQWSDDLDKAPDTYVVNRDGSALRKLTDAEADLAPPAGGRDTHESLDKRWVTFAREGDIYLYDRAADKMRRLTRTSDVESHPRLTRDTKRVAYMRGGNLYTLALDGGAVVQLTDIRPFEAPKDPDEKKLPEAQEALKKEERALLDVIDRKAKKREEDKARRDKENPRKSWRLAKQQSVASLILSPDESYVLATINERPEDAKTAVVPDFVTEAGYTEDIRTRTKVGDLQVRPRLAVVRVDTGEQKWIDHGQKTKDDKGKEVDRQVALTNPQWSDDGRRLAVLGESADNKDRWVMSVNPNEAATRILFHEHDDAWVNGPGSSALGWLADNRTLYFQSEKDGWSHLYTVDTDSAALKQITSGKWEVQSVELSKDKQTFWLETSEASLHERHFYSVPVSGGQRTRITTQTGSNEVTLSPDERTLAVIHSYSNRPPELYLMANQTGAAMQRVTTSPAPEFTTYSWLDVPIVQVPARDGAQVPARLYKPKGWKRGGPAVIFVHGAGYLQNVHRWWSSYFREYMFHHLLMERGYLVIDVDYRASAGYGRDWRAAIYRHMGGKDLDDQIDAAQWIVKEHGVDAKRIGIYGGSYGGFITLMAMFTQPDVFAAGAALRPVTDWAHYNHGYTSNILNTPQKDLEAYKKSSPIYRAAGLKGALLMCHGMVDINVHFQDTVRLAQKLIELRKENWEVAIYPVEDHAFRQPSSWADEYKRILKLFETNVRK